MPLSRPAAAPPGLDRPMARIISHEEVCAERYERLGETLGQIRETLAAHDGKFDRIDRRFEGLNAAAWGVAGTLGLLAVSIIAYLFVHVWPPGVQVPSPQAYHWLARR